MILYVRHHEETSCLKIYLTSDLRQVFIEGQYDPKNLTALAHHLKILRSLMFMNSPEFGTRIISI
ncbi:hypothetical protein BDR07DRAFT_1414021 [Suillus spraguei]|nr:hypothetical protein BDR07DRAFT_1414021 [Suillus spraguei]